MYHLIRHSTCIDASFKVYVDMDFTQNDIYLMLFECISVNDVTDFSRAMLPSHTHAFAGA